MSCPRESSRTTARGTVAFHLEEPDPDFLYKLAMPFASVLPPNTPKAINGRSVPATGPYVIANYEPGRQLELVRNPHFREWSPTAQPQGFADEIVDRFDVKPRKGGSLLISGRADVVGDDVGNRLEEITTRYPEQTLSTVLPGTIFLSLNTRCPPVRRRACSTSGELRRRSRGGGRYLGRTELGERDMSGASSKLPQLRALLPVHL